MSSRFRASKNPQSSINYHRLPLDDLQVFEQDSLLNKERGGNHQLRPSPQSGRRCTDRRLTTPQFVSALAGIWNLVGHPESSGTIQRSERYGISSREGPVYFSRDQQGHTCTPLYVERSSGLRSSNCSSTPNSLYEDLSSVKRTLMLTSFSSVFGACSVWRDLRSINKVSSAHNLQCENICSNQNETMEMENTEAVESGERSMGKEIYAASSNVGVKDDKSGDNYYSQTRSMPTELCAMEKQQANTHDHGTLLHDTEPSLEIYQENSHFSAGSVQKMEIDKEATTMPGNQTSSKACLHVQLNNPVCTSVLVGGHAAVNSIDADQHSYRDETYKHHFLEKFSQEVEPTVPHQFDSVVAINRHAVAGALAGTVVSISLHPVDTVKTVIQSNSCGRSSFYNTLRCTLVERGILGLYGGLASKLACSAPISAIYTLTYEIVKGALLPVLPKEYHSIAHCTAGGCSSIATSFIFTPSECIKQQMQVGSQYQNCWNALVGCLRMGGVASLYAGWGAVLCRNIPHSIVKFYAYESLKQFLLKSEPDDAKLNSGQTLLCGGFAGSTAALFTTPFDVVKTRVQLQAFSPVSKYQGILHALKEIFQQEGLYGLYRGLTPRLAMYMSQGAIFFTSYEFLKTILFHKQALPARNF